MWRIVMVQNGGCDYTIGCGVAFQELAAKTKEEAIEEAKEFFFNKGHHYIAPNSEQEIFSAFLVEDHGDSLPIKQWKKEYSSREQELRQKRIEAKELAELERLKKKYEK